MPAKSKKGDRLDPMKTAKMKTALSRARDIAHKIDGPDYDGDVEALRKDVAAAIFEITRVVSHLVNPQLLD